MLQLHPLHAHDPWWPLILGFLHQEPCWPSFFPSGQHIRDAVALTRCSRGAAGRFIFPYGIHFVQVERIAAIYHRCHEWMDTHRLCYDLDENEVCLNEVVFLPNLPNVAADPNPSPFSPWSDGA